ncbi:hypothetical protein Kpol_461p15 [Vanderwaltozyma polyspora DSM 70294]|uniref:Major facilitator superfamily (MFS) profile domain-containing protein n=1 Tax=Vanderwaltozyma polyspora (strain ATCC 22028 / DSM 70294 / BCRC 21397 / CBS 2163 / NBRC 10782 / NRRL Y-8283 / UCD 57-17) TaxID=436907 RepID=A7TR51_VANPO|nr:uncharacterized protein Kpol_461p15 [Vanderwaltozyma polyspora DSM 70294]EDO15261.1 hypothetical protein Kpol_461p15 [Vanderwaltozyma polyspora DSM 70294]
MVGLQSLNLGADIFTNFKLNKSKESKKAGDDVEFDFMEGMGHPNQVASSSHGYSTPVVEHELRKAGILTSDEKDKGSIIETGTELGPNTDDSADEEWVMEHDDNIPDGGWEAWLVVFGSFVGLIPVYGIFNSLGALESYIKSHQLADVELSTTSWIFSIFLAVTCFGTILTGSYFDRNGGFYPHIIGSILFLSGLVATANCTTVWQFMLAFSVTCGLGSGFLITPLVGSVATWFLRKRGIATCIATIGGSVGGVIFPIMLRKLYGEVGFEWAIRIFALICGCCLVCSSFLAREREKPVTEPFSSKKEMIVWYLTSSLNWRYFLEPRFLFTALASAFAENSLTATSTYLASYAIFKGNSESTSYTLLTAINAIGILGRYIPGYLADRWVGRFNIAIITIFIAAFVNLIIWLPFGGNSKGLWAYTIIYGFFSGTVLSLAPPCVGQISRTSDFGRRFSTVWFTEGLMTIPVIPICGAIIGEESDRSYNNFIIFSSMLMIAAGVFYSLARYTCVGFRMVKF